MSLISNKPFILRPAAKDYLWGGNRINEEFAKEIDMFPLAETWECSTHPDGPSIVASGEYCGQTLDEVLKTHQEYLGTKHAEGGILPLLVKFIDADKDLSVQVHPDDDYAREKENGQLGKNEMWYVLDAKPGATLVYGMKDKLDTETVRKAAISGELGKYLQRIPVTRGDVFFVKAGTVHAIGEGVLIAEIQENSNLTYRLYDYDRIDKDGRKRPIHLKEALEVADLSRCPEPRQPIRVLKYGKGYASELLCRSRYFEVYRMLVNTDRRQEVYYKSDELSFRVLMCIGGCGTLCFGGELMNIYKGDCVFVPASSEEIRLHGQLEILDVHG